MNRIVSVLLLALIVAVASAAQDDPDIIRVPVDGLPAGARVARYAVVPTEAGNVLVTELETADGTAAFYVFDYIDHVLTARSVGPRSIPVDLSPPPVARPVTRDLEVPGDRFWEVSGFPGSDRNEQLLSAPPLDELQFALVGASPWQLSPPPDHPLAVRRMTIATDLTVLDECLIEPNITAAVDRMTTGGAWWVRPYGEPHLLVGVLHEGPGEDRREGLRLYNERHELVATTEPVIDVDANAIPDLVQADLSGNETDELLVFPTAEGSAAPIVVYRFERRAGARRILAFNLCSVRMNGPDVVRLQRALEGRGFSVGPHGLDGWYGPDTRAAVIRFQRASDMPVTGVVDDTVWESLGL
ncbi:MAG: peptidoglycan-binding domain-containing protein [Spirochaetota bacterium]